MCLAAYTAAALLAVNSTLQQRNVSAAGTQLAFDTPKHTQCKKYQQPGQHCASCCRWKAAQLAKRRKAEQLAAQQQQQLAAADGSDGTVRSPVRSSQWGMFPFLKLLHPTIYCPLFAPHNPASCSRWRC